MGRMAVGEVAVAVAVAVSAPIIIITAAEYGKIYLL